MGECSSLQPADLTRSSSPSILVPTVVLFDASFNQSIAPLSAAGLVFFSDLLARLF